MATVLGKITLCPGHFALEARFGPGDWRPVVAFTMPEKRARKLAQPFKLVAKARGWVVRFRRLKSAPDSSGVAAAAGQVFHA